MTLWFGVLTCCVFLFTPAAMEARSQKHWGAGMSVDLDLSCDEAVKLVNGVAEDGIIRGTWEYRGSSELAGAHAAKTASGFPPWNGQGVVIYKVRPGTLAPEHFYDTADRGTVAVRYILEPAGATATKLRIDAIFDEDNHHHQHPSDGQVEDQEFVAISDKITELAEHKQQQARDSAQEAQEKQIQDLREQLSREQAAIEAAHTKEDQFQHKAQEANGGKPATVRTEIADLKIAPYAQSKTLKELSQGELVTILVRTQHWYRIQTSSGEQGWVYRLMLEVGE